MEVKMKFRKVISAKKKETPLEWQSNFLKYKRLRKRIKGLKAERRHDRETDSQAVEEFEQELDREIEKIVLFFLGRQGALADQLSVLNEGRATVFKDLPSTSYRTKVQKLLQEYREVGHGLVALLGFLEINTDGIRRILRKLEVKSWGSDFIVRRLRSDDDQLSQLASHEGIQSLAVAIRRGLCELHDLVQTHSSIRGLLSEDELRIFTSEPILDEIFQARKKASRASEFLDRSSALVGIFEVEDETILEHERRLQAYDPVSVMLNTLSTFLYIVSYYVVAPTGGVYAVYLGLPESYNGILIGAAPIAGLFSAVLYSWWANRSFKRPLIFCSICCLVGSFLYAMAFSFRSFSMIMVGRLLTGLGGARAVNRRYIADNVPLRDRTRVSSEFVTASAVGMAAGPGLSSLLSLIPNWSVGAVNFNHMTSPGWLSFFLWALYLIILVIHFKEPPRVKDDHPEPLKHSQGDEESQPLLSGTLKTSIWRELVGRRGVLHLLWVYFIIKYACEIFVASASVVSYYYFQWSNDSVGIYLAFSGLLMLPANFLLSSISQRFDERSILVVTELVLACSCFMIVPFLGVDSVITKVSSAIQYLIFGLVLFISSNVVEGITMSLLSKVMPRSLAKGTFNSGLLSSQSGMLGRAVGDISVTLSSVCGMRYLASLAFLPATVAIVATALATTRLYPFLHPSVDESSLSGKSENKDDSEDIDDNDGFNDSTFPSLSNPKQT